MEAALVPFPAIRSLNAAPVQIVCQIGVGPAFQKPVENLPDDCRLVFPDHELPVGACSITKGRPGVDHGFAGIVHQPAPDVLGHVLRIELIDVHHRPEREPAGSGVTEVLLNIQAMDTLLQQRSIVDHGLQHVPTHAVGFPCDDVLEPVLLAVGHHSLEGWPVVRLPGHGCIGIDLRDRQPFPERILRAFLHLLLDGDIPLGVGRIPSIDYSIGTGRRCFLLRAHSWKSSSRWL